MRGRQGGLGRRRHLLEGPGEPANDSYAPASRSGSGSVRSANRLAGVPSTVVEGSSLILLSGDERRAAALKGSGFDVGWSDGDLGHGKTFVCKDPDGHVIELYYDTEWYEPPSALKPALKKARRALRKTIVPTKVGSSPSANPMKQSKK